MADNVPLTDEEVLALFATMSGTDVHLSLMEMRRLLESLSGRLITSDDLISLSGSVEAPEEELLAAFVHLLGSSGAQPTPATDNGPSPADVLHQVLAQLARDTAQFKQQQDAERAPLANTEAQAKTLAHEVAVGTLRYVGAGRVCVRQVELGTVLSLDPKTKTCTVRMQIDAVSPPITPHRVSYGSGSPTVGKSYPVHVPYILSREPNVERGWVPDPSHLPWLLAPGGSKFYYAVGTLDRYPPHWPRSPKVAVMAIDWPLPTAADVRAADLAATSAGGFDFTTEYNAGNPLSPARFIGVDGYGTVWAMVETVPPVPDSFHTPHPDGSIEIGATFQHPVVSFLGSIPAQGTGEPDPHQQCPDNIVPVAVDATPGHGGLLSVGAGIWAAQERTQDFTGLLDPYFHGVQTLLAIGNNHRIDHYDLHIGSVLADSRAVSWGKAGSVTGEGKWLRYHVALYRKVRSDGGSSADFGSYIADRGWKETYHEPIEQGILRGFKQSSYFAYAYPAAELANTIWTDANGVRRFRAAFVTYPDPTLKDGPLYFYNSSGQLYVDQGESIPNTDGFQHYGPIDPQEIGTPFHQEELDPGRYATYFGESDFVSTWAISGLPYGMWGAGPSGATGEWAIATRIPSRQMSVTHDQDTLLAVLTTGGTTSGGLGGLGAFPAHGEFTLSRIIARSQDGQQILAEDTVGTYNANEQSMSPGRLWQTTDGGATWDRLAFRITDLPAPSGQQAQGYGFIVDSGGT